MKRIVLVLFCILAFPVWASHIVGGEFEIIHINGNTYRVNLILYFDELNGNPNAEDQTVNARIFRKRDNAVMRLVTLPLSSESAVSYTQPECSKGEIKTRKLIYTTVIILSETDYADPEGYYIAWERCCRNYSITNIYSQVPNPGAIYAGQTFYLEFPPIVKNGQPFYNSTPRLFPPLNDYACPNKPYYVDFAGTDDDGDSLVYSLVTPLNTKSADALPLPDFLPRPSPYPAVSWRPPYGPANILGGAPDLKISTDGFLTATPMFQGLFVFAVRVEEFRDGVKLGEVRRDFQMLVLDKCPRAEPPQILGKKMTDAAFTYDENMAITFSNTVSDENRCIQVQVSDPDASKADDSFTENIKITAIPLSFKKDISGILPDITTAVLTNGSTVTFDICFDKCPYVDGPFQIGILVHDDACSLPLWDTLRVNVNIQPPPNSKPYFTTANITRLGAQSLNEGDHEAWPIEARDDDGDQLTISMIGNTSLSTVGMSVLTPTFAPGLYNATFDWDTRCDVYDFRKQTSFEIKFLVEDQDLCKIKAVDTMIFKLQVRLPGNFDPVISTNLTQDEVQNGVTRRIFEDLNFKVFGTDRDGDYLELDVEPKGFALSSYDMTFPVVEGFAPVESQFNWHLDCNKINLAKTDEFLIDFIVVDGKNKCRFYKADTLKLKVKVLPPFNAEPQLTIVNNNPELTFFDHRQTLTIGQQISLGLTATDASTGPVDYVKIEMIDKKGNVAPTGYEYADANGDGFAQTTFTWNPDCSIFRNDVYENNYTFKFRAFDNRCFSASADTVEVEFVIRDIEAGFADFIPPNVITANDDGCNDFFGLEEIEDLRESCEGEHVLPQLPPDNCRGVFVSILIYNRWGNPVFESGSRNFRWYAKGEAAGVYYYTLAYSNKEFKGSIIVRN